MHQRTLKLSALLIMRIINLPKIRLKARMERVPAAHMTCSATGFKRLDLSQILICDNICERVENP